MDNQYKDISTNILLQQWELPPFDKINDEVYFSAFEQTIAQTKKNIQTIIDNTAPADFENTIMALDRSDWQLEDICNLFFNLLEANANETLQNEAEKIVPMLVAHEDWVAHNAQLFTRVKTVYDNQSQQAYEEDELTLLTKTYDSFVRNGALLSDKEKEEFSAINQELSKLSLQYKNNLLKVTADYHLYFSDKEKDLLEGIPATNLQTAAEKAQAKGYKNGWIFDLSMPSYNAFMKYATCRSKRQELYLAYNSRALEGKYSNRKIVSDMANNRLKIARLLGFDSYADYILCKRMAKDKSTVKDFLQQLLYAFKPIAQKELQEMQQYAREKDHIDLQAWDWAYYANCRQKEKYNYDEQLVKPFFALEYVQKGVFELANRLYGLSFKERNDVSVYHKDVKVFEVIDKDKSKLAMLYMDFFPRNSKQNGAWMTEFRPQRVDENGKRIIPLISLVFNFSPATEDTPSLLTFNEVSTFLHEFGHALHGMMSNVRFTSLSGTSVERDFVELPSQIMENWAEEKDFLKLFAYHYQTGALIDDDIVQKIKSLNNYLVGYLTLRQLNFGYLDMAFHSIEEAIKTDAVDFEQQATIATQLLPRVEGTAICTSFSHIFGGGYAAGYYGYKWAEVLDADAFEEFYSHGIFSTEVAERFRKTILSQGGNVEAMKRYIRFKGKKPEINALLKRCGIL
ncbi:MAG: M3 family metallopeptidase [Bacteroidales bacterium]|nr:M3 family metallopeptidase [Bacteroidales bacterium]